MLLWSEVKTARVAAALAGAPGTGQRAGLVEPVNTPVRATAPGLATIAASERALVFVYAPNCVVCHATMANWDGPGGRPAEGRWWSVFPPGWQQTPPAR